MLFQINLATSEIAALLNIDPKVCGGQKTGFIKKRTSEKANMHRAWQKIKAIML